MPGHRRIVCVASCHQPSGPTDPLQLLQCRYRVAQVLQDLVSVHDVERVVSELQVVGVAGQERGALDTSPSRLQSGLTDDVGGAVDPGDVSWSHIDARSQVMVPGPQPTSSS